ncbi:hypothetical protein TBKG_01043 [Mycobacterium tuberculosis '98-R604 INH-RIF-EM']|uniref:Uncharacterized protein n=2 Tax=Mycobacterium tuberculosis TaxID=1773 RepID=Q8VKP8_MYCTO|nr:hypothetical protein MT0204.1 [Mycobacterium tuberculosis CDC1551]AGL21969.1 hypothetical protein I917_01400 [Mycobacterium tuberculosis str. Haarlem/NITR202]EPZ63080.1 hypothetical protein TBKG_01043 [Mycobacterium tuberculosis '98-R604 INH-RIF-EM']EUA96501.1 hypothetical protein Z030_01065 [Mycobacterium tuberculosis INS_XDR]EUA98453.1 hypothetical protein Z028_01065 [Mycobacterium tuberculosis INS_MDR]EUB00202.1 hypothetical protein Z029_01055 [Mycobacterium tuberculosis INS_SEN]
MGGELTGRRIPTVVVDLPNQRLLATNMCPRLASAIPTQSVTIETVPADN